MKDLEKLTLENLEMQFCSHWLKKQIRLLLETEQQFNTLRELDRKHCNKMQDLITQSENIKEHFVLFFEAVLWAQKTFHNGYEVTPGFCGCPPCTALTKLGKI